MNELVVAPIVEEKALPVEAKVSEPLLYKVVMHNDDYTPMDFVISVLEMFFQMDRVLATNIMYQIHIKGNAVCGIYTRDIAETKANQVMDYARMHQHPLLCSIEEA